MAGFKRLRFLVTASRSATGIPSAYINNFIQIWCGAPFYGIPCGSNSCWMYLKPHGPLFESSGRKYIWIRLLSSNTDDSRSRFHRADCKLWRAIWSEFISTVCRMVVYSAPSWETAIVWNQLKGGWKLICSLVRWCEVTHCEFLYQRMLRRKVSWLTSWMKWYHSGLWSCPQSSTTSTL